jgi:hypothetical protein
MRAEITIYEDNKEPKTYELEVSSIHASTDKELGMTRTDYYYKFKYTTVRMGEVREC